ncbi:MAG: PHP domain-containing protein [Chloroflexi bacterium]|nr:PHP domain-containing protein [Chloroflexota bacterium]
MGGRRDAGTPHAASIGDFHCHSTASDGRLAPAEVVRLAAARGVRVLALTDHDTTAGLAEAGAEARRATGFRLIPGVELSCDVPGNELHLLGLFIDPVDGALQARLERMRAERVERARRITAALEREGAPVHWARVQAIAGEASVGRPHVARALVEAGHVSTIEQAFDRFLARGQPAYVERERLDPAEAIALVRGARGLAVFAHPSFSDDHEAHAETMARLGLAGLEVYYRDYDTAKVAGLRALAERFGLVPTGGSDFHSFDRDGERAPGEIPLPDAAVERILQVAREAGCRVPEPAGGAS